MKTFKQILKHPLIKNKYILASVVFLIWIGFIDENSLAERVNLEKNYQQLLSDKSYFQSKIEADTYETEKLDNNSNLEVIAREKYLMKKKNEDIFVIKKH